MARETGIVEGARGFGDSWAERRVKAATLKVATLAGAGAVALVTVGVLSSPNDTLRYAALATAAGALFLWGCRYTTKNPAWLPFAFVLEESIPYLNIIPIDPKTRWFLRYPILIPLCLPTLKVLREGKFWQGRVALFMIFFGWSALSVSYSLDPVISAGRLLPDLLLFVALAYAVLDVNDSEGMQKLIETFLIGCGLLQLLTLVSWAAFPSSLTHVIDDQGLIRFTGLSSDPNAVGSLMLATVGAGVIHWGFSRGWRKFLLATMMLIAVVFGVMADSRSELGVTLAGCIAYAIWKRPVKGLAAAGAVLIVGVGGYNLLGTHLQRYLNRDIWTLTGRTDAWRFELQELKLRPLLGYGYEVEGAIFENRYFDNWQEAWNQGPNSALHNSYLTVMVGVGIPAFVLWLVVVLGPWVALFRKAEDTWNLKPAFFLVVLPMLMLGLDESGVSEPRYVRGLLFFACWLIAERYQMVLRARVRAMAEKESGKLSPAVVALIHGAH